MAAELDDMTLLESYIFASEILHDIMMCRDHKGGLAMAIQAAKKHAKKLDPNAPPAEVGRRVACIDFIETCNGV